MNDLDRKIWLREWGIELPTTSQEKEDWLNKHGFLRVYIKDGGYHGDWDYGYASHLVHAKDRWTVIDHLYDGAKNELFSWCFFHED